MYLYTAPPGPPTGVTAVQSGPTSVSVSWTAPTSGGPVSRYDIYYVANGVPSTSGGSTTSTSNVLTNLQVGVQYSISVIAVGTYIPSQGGKNDYMLCLHLYICRLLVQYYTSNLSYQPQHLPQLNFCPPSPHSLRILSMKPCHSKAIYMWSTAYTHVHIGMYMYIGCGLLREWGEGGQKFSWGKCCGIF